MYRISLFFLVLVLAGSMALDTFAKGGNKPLTIKSSSTLVSTDINTVDDIFPAVLATGVAVNPKLGRMLFSNQFETEPNGTCDTESGAVGDLFSLVQGTLVINVSRNNNQADQIIIQVSKMDVCFDLSIPPFGTFTAIQEGQIVDGTGEFEGATGSLAGTFQGTIRASDIEDGKLQTFANVTGTSELTIDY